MLIMKKDNYEKILKYAQDGAPNEVCGLLGGKIERKVAVVTDVYCLHNMDQSPSHFSMDPQEQFAVVKELRRKGKILLGNFHSHPQTLAWPSDEDIRLAFDPTMHYLIVSLMEEANPMVYSFHIEKKMVTKEELVIQ